MIGGSYLGQSYLAGSAYTPGPPAPTVQRINLWPVRQVAARYARRAPGQTLEEVLQLQSL